MREVEGPDADEEEAAILQAVNCHLQIVIYTYI